MKPFESMGGALAVGELSEVKLSPAWGLSPRKVSLSLKKLERAVSRPRTRRVGRATRNELWAAGVEIGRADLEALRLLMRRSGSRALGGGWK